MPRSRLPLVVSVLNGERLLWEAVGGGLDQGSRNHEFITTDGGLIKLVLAHRG
jgi:hypothetical protein